VAGLDPAAGDDRPPALSAAPHGRRPQTIGKHVSSGCIRLTNEDVSDLYARVNVGTKVVVLPMTERRAELR
jgi:hypothetical protein